MENSVDGLEKTILALLRRLGPLTSGKMIKELGKTPASVYTTLSVMRNKRLIETWLDPEDGQRKNQIVALA